MKGSIKNVLGSFISIIGLAFAAAVFAAQAGPQVSPSAINLQNENITDLTFHTDYFVSEIDLEQGVSLTLSQGNEYAADLTSYVDPLSFRSDGTGHLVFDISWAEFLEDRSPENPEPEQGEATFTATVWDKTLERPVDITDTAVILNR